MSGRENFAAFAREVERYAEFHWRHEAEVVLPWAERGDRAKFARDRCRICWQQRSPDGPSVEKDFERLFTRIVNIAPLPIGVGRDSKGG